MAKVEIVGGEALPKLAQLQPVAEAIFGAEGRRPDWFARKLWREGVEPELCAVARAGEDILGYALLGRVPSRGPVARGAGVGVLPHVRGRGLGRALLESSCERAARRGCAAVEFLTEDARLPWYEAAGFVAQRRELCLGAPGLGSAPKLAPLVIAEPERRGVAPAWAWFEEAWTRTPPTQRLLVGLDGVALWLTRERRAWLAVRAEADTRADLPAALAELRQRLPAHDSLLLYPLEADSTLARELAAQGFEIMQRSTLVRRPTRLTVSD